MFRSTTRSLQSPTSNPEVSSLLDHSEHKRSINKSIKRTINRFGRRKLLISLLAFFIVLYNVTVFPLLFRSFNSYVHPATNQLTDPLPSCSIINQNLTVNLLHHQWMFQDRHVHSDCSNYTLSRTCIHIPINQSNNQTIDQSINQSIDQSNKLKPVVFRPRWLVFRLVQGTGGLADRTKGLLTCLTLALLTGRAFSIEIDRPGSQTVTLSLVYSRSVLHWIWADRIDQSIALSKHRRDLYWLDEIRSPFKQVDWRDCQMDNPNDDVVDCADIIVITYNLNGFVDVLDNPRLVAKSRKFGFHSLTEKGDLDMYFDCLMSYAFTFTDVAIQSINQMMQSINRLPVKSWAEIQPIVPTLQQLISAQSNNQLIKPSSSYQSIDQINQSEPLFCVQIRMGKNARFEQSNNQSNNQAVGFSDSEAFLSTSHFTHIFDQMDHLIKQSNDQSINLLITSDSPEFESYLPSHWRAQSNNQSINQSINQPVIHRVIIPGHTGHIDKLKLADQSIQQSALINTIVTYHMLGECDVAAVSISGFGTSAMWRTRNTQLIKTHQSIKQSIKQSNNPSLIVFTDAAYQHKYLINETTGDLFPYRHIRGSGGREYDTDYKPRPQHVIDAIKQLIDQSVWDALSPSKYGFYQSSSALTVKLPDDPLCEQLKFSYD